MGGWLLNRYDHEVQHSAVWRQSRRYLRSEEYSEEWREGCYCFFCYAAEYAQAPATAVLAALIATTTPTTAWPF